MTDHAPGTTPHTVTVHGWLLRCTCGFQDFASALSVLNHAATHEPPATVTTPRKDS